MGAPAPRLLAVLERADAGLRVEGETPVEQGRSLIPIRRSALFDQPVHHGDHQAAAAAGGGTHERLASGVGVARLAADRARVPLQQLVLVDDQLFAVIAGNIAEGSAVICANTGLAIAARKMTTRSCAVDARSRRVRLGRTASSRGWTSHLGWRLWRSSWPR